MKTFGEINGEAIQLTPMPPISNGATAQEFWGKHYETSYTNGALAVIEEFVRQVEGERKTLRDKYWVLTDSEINKMAVDTVLARAKEAKK